MRVLLAIHNVYTDPTSGAARSMRTLVEWLAEAGHEVRVLATARFDAHPPEPIEDHLAGLGVPLEDVPSPGPCRVVRFTFDRLPVTTLLTQHNDARQPDREETAQFLALLDGQMADFAPEVLLSCGGHVSLLEALHRARQRGLLTCVRVANYGFEDRRWFGDVDSILMTSPFLSDYYRKRIGLVSTGIPSPIRWAEVIAEKHDPEFLTFVNPSLHKGAALFARLADMLGSRRPDIPILVVQSASAGLVLKEFSEIDLGKYRHIHAGPATPIPADFLALTRLLLVPSVFAEPFGRVAAEAMINGIPPLVSDRGCLPETVSGAGRVLPLPAWMTPNTPRLPSEAEVEPWFQAVCELWDNPEAYAAASALARQTGEQLYSEAVLKGRHLAWFAGLRRGQPVFAFPDKPARPVSRTTGSFFRLRSPAGSVWPALAPLDASPVWAAYLELDRTQWLPREQLERKQLAQVRTLLAHCLEHVPIYREVLTAARVDPAAVRTLADFRRLPLLSRPTVQERGADLRAEALPPGSTVIGSAATFGTTGMPLEVLQTNVVHLWWLACCLRDLRWAGIDPRGKIALIRRTGLTGADLERARQGVALSSWHAGLATLVETGPAMAMDIGQAPERQLEWLRDVQPDYLLTFPSNLQFLAGLIRSSGQRISSLRAIQTIAETLDEPVREEIEAAFGAPVKDCYSCAEAGYLASPCPEGHGMHVHAENVLLEVLDEAGQPCAPGQTGRVVLTTLHNYANPFIRYEILDEATVGPDVCSCGRGLPLLSRVLGRRLPLLHLPGGRRKAPSPLLISLQQLRATHQFQLIQKAPDAVLVRLVPNQDWTPGHAEQVRRLVEDYFEAPVRVDVELWERLDLAGGGKLRVVLVECDSSGSKT